MKAKNAPTLKIAKLATKILLLHRRPPRHALRSSGSVGQGALRFIHSQRPLPASNKPAAENRTGLFSEIHIKPGTLDANPAITAPKPKLTSNAGRAQQRSVLSDVNKVRKFISRLTWPVRFSQRRNRHR